MHDSIGEEINALAYELAKCTTEEKARRKTLEERICEKELSSLKEFGGKAYFPLAGKFNGKFAYDDFFEVFLETLAKVLHHYDPDKATFTTAFRFHLQYGLMDLSKEMRKQGIYVDWSDLNAVYEDGEEMAFDPPDPYIFTDDIESELDKVCNVAKVIAERRQQELHLGKSKRGFFEGFFTFDLTKLIRVKREFGEREIYSANDILFPAMDTVVLEYLMWDVFAHMLDILRNKLRDIGLFKKRLATIERCYDLAHPTAVSRSRDYEAFFTAV